MNIREMRQERGELSVKLRNFHENIGDREWTAEEQDQWDTLIAERRGLDKRIERAEELNEAAPEVRTHPVEPFVDEPPDDAVGIAKQSEQERKDTEEMEFRHWMRTGTLLSGQPVQSFYIRNALQNEDSRTAEFMTRVGAMSAAGNKAAQAFESRVQVVGTDSSGGFAVPDEMMRPLVYAMKRFNNVLNVATVINTATGADLPIPTVDDTSTTQGALIGENTDAGTQDATFAQVVLEAYKYSSKAIRISLELLQDASFDTGMFISRIVGERIGRIQGSHYTNGTGTNQPRGVMVAATRLGSNLANSTTTLTFAQLVSLLTSVDAAYQMNSGWMFNQTTHGLLAQIVGNNTTQPIWYPSTSPEMPDMLLGKPVYVNDFCDNFAASAEPVAYGDFSNYLVRNVMGIELFRQNETHIQTGNIGFIGFARSDADLIDAGTDPIKKYQLAA